MLATKLLGGGSAVEANYIEDVFSTYLYTGNGSTQTINNGIDLAGKGGLVWGRRRSACSNILIDTNRGTNKLLKSESTAAPSTETQISSFNSSGFSLNTGAELNTADAAIVSWTFRKQPKFFDVVTYTGDGVAGRTVAHNLGSVPGCIIVKRIDSIGDWAVYHRSLGNNTIILLQSTAASSIDNWWNDTTPTSTQFYLSTDPAVNSFSATYVAYIFAHNAGGFGLTGTDNVISCGSFTTPSGATDLNINLGWEPQWLMLKSTNGSNGFYDKWSMVDTMRGMALTSSKNLYANSSVAEQNWPTYDSGILTANGFIINPNANPTVDAGKTYIYIAIRRGPMKVPTDATKVFNSIARTGTGAVAQVTGVGFAPDMVFCAGRVTDGATYLYDKLRGVNRPMMTSASYSEINAVPPSPDTLTSFLMDGYGVGADTALYNTNINARSLLGSCFRRAPSFFDEVCYTGTGSATTFSHNLGVVPELIIVKDRSGTTAGPTGWMVYSKSIPNTSFMRLDLPIAYSGSSATYWNATDPTSTVFSIGSTGYVNTSGDTFVAYLFATCAGVSKVGSYTGTGATQTIACGFAAGARFVLIKRTDSTGDWYVWDSARGIVSANDPHLSLNTTAAEVTSNDSVDPASTGFIVNQVAATNINVSGGSYIFLAIA